MAIRGMFAELKMSYPLQEKCLLLAISALIFMSPCLGNVETCPKHQGNLRFDGIKTEGHATVDFEVQNTFEAEMDASITLTCSDLEVSGNGRDALHMSEPVAEEDFIDQERDTVRHCIARISMVQSRCDSSGRACDTTEKECSLGIRTFLGRIMPTCGNASEGLAAAENLISSVQVFHDLGKIHVHLRTSPNEILSFNPHCSHDDQMGHNTSAMLERYSFSLNEETSGPTTLSLSFRPECSNTLMAPMYYDVPMSGCRLEVYRYCQDGIVLMDKRDIGFDAGTVFCPPPPGLFEVIIAFLKVYFGMDSMPIVCELLWLAGNVIMYLILAPLVFYRCCIRPRILPKLFPSIKNRSYKAVEEQESETLLNYKEKPQDDEPTPQDEDILCSKGPEEHDRETTE